VSSGKSAPLPAVERLSMALQPESAGSGGGRRDWLRGRGGRRGSDWSRRCSRGFLSRCWHGRANSISFLALRRAGWTSRRHRRFCRRHHRRLDRDGSRGRRGAGAAANTAGVGGTILGAGGALGARTGVGTMTGSGAGAGGPRRSGVFLTFHSVDAPARMPSAFRLGSIGRDCAHHAQEAEPCGESLGCNVLPTNVSPAHCTKLQHRAARARDSTPSPVAG